jgi:serine protease Do
MLGGCTQAPDFDTAKPSKPSTFPIGMTPHGPAIGENTFADLAEEASKSVVNIDTRTSVTVPDAGLPFSGFDLFFGGPEAIRPQNKMQFEHKGTGSGVIIRSDGYILTNNHVAGQAQDIKVTLNDKRVFPGHLVGRDSFTDLALLKIDANDLPVAKLGTAKQLRPGDFVVAIGSPVGLDHTVTLGIVSALGRSLNEKGLQSDVGLVQTDAAINPGNSGGPLLNIRGEVIGLNTAIRRDAQNIGFAIPVDVAKDISNQLIEHGSIRHAYVGLSMQDLSPALAKALHLPANTQGVVVAQVMQGSPAEAAAMQTGDVIEKVDGKPVASAKDVQQIVRTHKPGDSLSMVVSRGGELQAVELTIGDYPSPDQNNR